MQINFSANDNSLLAVALILAIQKQADRCTNWINRERGNFENSKVKKQGIVSILNLARFILKL